MTPVFAHGQLRLYLLALLEQGPRHGYEVITALADRFGGTYRPSAGTIYPRLARLEEEGLVRRTEGDRRSTYALTDAGRAELDARRGDLAELEENLAETVRALADQVRSDVRDSMRGLRADLAAAAQEARAGATTASSTRSPDERVAARIRLSEAEAELRQFRDELRTELRTVTASGEPLTPLTLDTIRTVLDQARTSIRATLR